MGMSLKWERSGTHNLFQHITGLASADPNPDFVGPSAHKTRPDSQDTSIRGLPKDWRRRPGRPRCTWLRTLEADLQPLNHGLNSAWRHAQDRGRWRQLMETATLQSGACPWWWWWWWNWWWWSALNLETKSHKNQNFYKRSTRQK